MQTILSLGNALNQGTAQATVDRKLFLRSVDKISFFFEEKAFGDDGSLKQPNELSINKVGHALHELDPKIKEFSYSKEVSRLLSSLAYKRPIPLQSMYIFKSAKENRAAGVLDNFDEGEKYPENMLRKFVCGKSPEIRPGINSCFTDPAK
ncbi:hypothetical protein ACLB2K_044544 [Fragaria x ananassa]